MVSMLDVWTSRLRDRLPITGWGCLDSEGETTQCCSDTNCSSQHDHQTRLEDRQLRLKAGQVKEQDSTRFSQAVYGQGRKCATNAYEESAPQPMGQVASEHGAERTERLRQHSWLSRNLCKEYLTLRPPP